ncbi:MAG: hypothetical protein RBQ91_06780 [Acholeplasma sp.]|nr:hypothetical protein [Acholeplasma sp.]
MSNTQILLKDSNYRLLTNPSFLPDFKHIFATDLLSTAIKHIKNETALITLIVSQTTLSLALMLDLEVLIVTKDAVVNEAFIMKANEQGLCVIYANYLTHEVIKDIYQRGIL